MSEPPDKKERRNPWTHVLVACCAAFIFTVFLMVASLFNGKAGALNRLFDRHGILVLGIEVGIVLAVAFIVLTTERRETRRQIEERERRLLAEAQAEEKRESEDLEPR
jgi:Na+/melibiose symporter-like transporter